MMQMMIVMMMMVISHIGSSEEIDVLSTEETTCSNDAEQVQVLVRELRQHKLGWRSSKNARLRRSSSIWSG